MKHLIRSVALLTILGCAGADEPDLHVDGTVHVSGLATYRGKALEGYRVTFIPANGRAASGLTDAAGRFELGTNEQGDGVVPGLSQISVAYDPIVPDPEFGPGRPMATEPPPPKVQIPSKFSDPSSSTLTVEVPDDGLTDYKLELK